MYTGTLLEFLNMGGGEIMLILAVVLLLFGGKKLPELARGLGKGIRDFKDASEGVKREIHRNINAMDLEKELNADSPAAAPADTYKEPDYATQSYTRPDFSAPEHAAPLNSTVNSTEPEVPVTENQETQHKPNSNI